MAYMRSATGRRLDTLDVPDSEQITGEAGHGDIVWSNTYSFPITATLTPITGTATYVPPTSDDSYWARARINIGITTPGNGYIIASLIDWRDNISGSTIATLPLRVTTAIYPAAANAVAQIQLEARLEAKPAGIVGVSVVHILDSGSAMSTYVNMLSASLAPTVTLERR